MGLAGLRRWSTVTAAWGRSPAVEAESGADQLRRVVRVLDSCREDALDGFTPEELILLVRLCWRSEWDVFVDDLSADQVHAALTIGEVPDFFDTGGLLLPLPSSLADAAAVHAWLCRHDRRGEVLCNLETCDRSVDADRERAYRTAQRVRSTSARKVGV